jgi:hypothetical protein
VFWGIGGWETGVFFGQATNFAGKRAKTGDFSGKRAKTGGFT